MIRNVSDACLKKNQSTPRPSEHPPVMGEKIVVLHNMNHVLRCNHKKNT